MTDLVEKSGPKAAAGGAVRKLVRQALKGALATLSPTTGAPYASLVTVATAADGAPLMLLSQLAVHTRNLTNDPRVCLLIDGTSAAGDPLAGGRVSLMGRIGVTADAAHRRRFLARHPDAEMYASFSDFAFYYLTVESAHYVGGFGRIVDLGPQDVLTDIRSATALLDAEEDIVAHMNADHADALALYAALPESGAPPPARDGSWRMIGIDPAGLDLAAEGMALRIDFPEAIATPGDARRALAALAAQARTRVSGG